MEYTKKGIELLICIYLSGGENTMIKSQKKGIICILLVVSFFMILSSSYAAPLSPGQFSQGAVDSTPVGGEILLIGGETYTILDEIRISKAITIKSNDSTKNAIINLENNRAFYIDNKGNLTLINITIINGKGDSGGAIVNNGGTLTVSGSTFSNNQADHFGGAIVNNWGTLIISDSTFSNNLAAYEGGAIWNFYGDLTVSGSTFSNNQITGFNGIGGAITNYGGILTVSGSTFSNNLAAYEGGAIWNYGDLIISGSTFSNNQADYFGGAIWNYGTLTVSFSVFYNNAGDKVIHSTDNVNLIDNFYFNPTITDLKELLDDFTNQPDSVRGLYYFEVSHGSVSYVGETLNFDFLSYYGDSKPSINQLPDLDISLYYNGQLISVFNYKDEVRVKLDSVANGFEFSFLGIDFGSFNVNVEERIQVDEDPVPGLPVGPTLPEDLDVDSSKNVAIQDEAVNDKTVGSEDNNLAKNNNPSPSPNPIKKATNSYALANVVYAASNEVNETNESKLNKSVSNPDKLSGKTNNWNLGIVLIAIFLVLAVLAIGFYRKKKNEE